ncbi:MULTISPECIES: hypothetical protein [Saccharothrix]|uniref:Uncharacterized protein n=2 Tax=Saccharothrix TaxID=2071 RepID=A0ABU0WXH5_9PSEU|nr:MULTISPECIES: hypothetical protein [Saccharothrix]MDQ2584511.1 hypothetical protein [Saccharothrix yanglingensis]MDR6597906.1 hypothetical protein [Saccharothrix longispora]MDU0291579.1 hypothetical protein [Saccharothrix longispora]
MEFIKVVEPRREWLLRCYSDKEDVLSLEVHDGAISVLLPSGVDQVSLSAPQIAAFREAFTEAVSRAEADLREVAAS